MHDKKKVAVLSLSAPSFKGILDVKQVLYLKLKRRHHDVLRYVI